MEEKLLLSIGIAAVLLAGILFALWIVKHRQLKLCRARKIAAGVLSVLLVAALAVNLVATRYTNLINQYFAAIDLNDPTIQHVRNQSTEAAKQLTDEGFVLLKNENGVLPMVNNKVNVFGYSSIDINFGGTGSGGANNEYNVGFYQALDNAGISYNTELRDFYQDSYTAKQEGSALVMIGGDYNNYEPSIDHFSDTLVENAKAFSDTALIVLTRNGGEGGDLPLDLDGYTGGKAGEHYLQLTQNEKDMVALVEENFANIIVIINSSNAMELGFLNDAAIDAALWIGGPGCQGCNSMAEMLVGKVNPSGRLADTYAYDLTSNPSYYNFGRFLYTNTQNAYHLIFENPSVFNGQHYAFANYAEGIYVGYRYYETRWIDNETNQCDETAYRQAVQYPFGYGLSYTTFSQTISGFAEEGDTITVDVTVTNTGDRAGKDAVQLYVTAPYNVGGIEKPFVSLLDFGKTKMLEPGTSETITFTFQREDLASYDYQNHRCYVLEQGTYEIKLMNNAHDLIESRTITVDQDVIYDDAHDGHRTTDLIAATNQFDDVSFGNQVTYVSRADWEGTLPTQRTENMEASEEIIYELEHQGLTDEQLQASAEDIVTASHGLTVDAMKGLDYDDPQWAKLLEQVTVDEMVNLIANGGYATPAVESVGKLPTVDSDGPQGINSLISENVSGVVFPAEVVVASTYNKELMEAEGYALGSESAAYGIAGLYGPAMNTHRSPFGGRNYEYYSEDGVLAGKAAAAFVRGANRAGVYCYMKHFALDEQETERLDISIWCNEQAMRELYFKPFELCAKEGGCTAVMASDSFIGATWAGEREELNNTVLRQEWGFRGMVITDFVTSNSKNADRMLRSGTDLSLTTLGNLTPSDLSSGNEAGRQALRTATHNILYTIANSNAQEISKDPFPTWIFLFAGLDAVLLILLAAVVFVPSKKKD